MVHLNERKVTSLSAAAVLADEFVLTHRTVFSSDKSAKFSVQGAEVQLKGIEWGSKFNQGGTYGGGRTAKIQAGEGRVCFYCLSPGHLIDDCEA